MTSSPLNDLNLDDIVGVPISPPPEIRDSLEIERIGDSWIQTLEDEGDLDAQPPYDSTFWKDLEASTEEKVEVLKEEVLESGVLPDILGDDTDTESEDDKPTIITSTGLMRFCKYCCKFSGESKVCDFHRCLINDCDGKRTSKGFCNAHYLLASKRCGYEGCRNITKTRGLCQKHLGWYTRKRCSFEGCVKQAQSAGLCVEHGAIQKKCSVVGCSKVVQNRGRCVEHGAKIARCSEDGCLRQAIKGGLCVTHGAKRNKCSYKDCNYNSKKDGLCCIHNPTYRRCINCQFYQVATLGDMCSTCAGYRQNSEEFKLREIMKDWFPDLKIVHDRIIEGSCLKYRPDFFIETPKGHIIIVEIDERHHDQYEVDCEVVRMFNIQQAIMTPIVFVRYNPDVYKPDGINTTVVKKRDRHRKLRATIARLTKFPPNFLPGIPEVEYLYYPMPRIEVLTEEYKQKINILM